MAELPRDGAATQDGSNPLNSAWNLLIVAAVVSLIGVAMSWSFLLYDVRWLGWAALAVYAVAFGFMAASLIVHFHEERQWTRLCQRLGAA